MYGKRDHGLYLRVSEEEKVEFERAAERHNMSAQALIRFVMRRAVGLSTPCSVKADAPANENAVREYREG